jgi:50S ribosomal subunit-associated GTPase HflX
VVPVSATLGAGFDQLLVAIDEASRGDTVGLDLLIPYGREGVLATLRRIGGVDRTEYVADGTRAWGWAPRHAAGRFEAYRSEAISGTNGSRRGRRRPG